MNEWEEWKKQRETKMLDVPKPKPAKGKEPIPTRPITAGELEKVRKLQKVRPAWWCQDGRFIEQFKHATQETQITERQAWYISVLWYKYRKQLGHNGPRSAGYR